MFILLLVPLCLLPFRFLLIRPLLACDCCCLWYNDPGGQTQVYQATNPIGIGSSSIPLITGIANYINKNPTTFAFQLGGTLLTLGLCVRFARSLQRVTTESLRGGKTSDEWGKLLGRVAYLSMIGLGMLVIVAIWGVYSYQDPLIQQLRDQGPIWLRNFGLTLLIVALMLLVGRIMQRASLRRMTHNRLDINLSVLISRFIYLCTLGVGAFIILAVWNVQLVVPVTVLGAVTVAISFSIQDILKNLVAGVYILVERPFRIGDEIMVDKYIGEVEDIHMRITTMRTISGEQVLIPNAIIFGSAVTNNTAYRRRRALLTVALPTEAAMSAEECDKAILDALKTVDGVLTDPPPDIQISSAVDQKITMLVHFWVPTDRLDVLSDVLFQVKRAVPSAEVSAPGVPGAA
jgi:small-conductance mechanosensitive channel